MGLFKKPIDKLASKMAFYPPDPPTYQLKERVSESGESHLYINADGVDCRTWPRITSDVFTLRTKHGTDIVAVYVATKKYSDPVILYNHGNAVDLGQMLPFCVELAKDLKCNVMAYDYTGYGRSTGQASIANSLNDISACLDWLYTAEKTPKDIVIYGQSIGSGPSVYAAAKQKKLGGLILHSPLASGMQVLKSDWGWWPSSLDVFPNSSLMPKVECPVLVMHGRQDEVIPVTHGEKLHSLAKRASRPLWDPDCGHQNLEISASYQPALERFMQEVFGVEYWKQFEL